MQHAQGFKNAVLVATECQHSRRGFFDFALQIQPRTQLMNDVSQLFDWLRPVYLQKLLVFGDEKYCVSSSISNLSPVSIYFHLRLVSDMYLGEPM